MMKSLKRLLPLLLLIISCNSHNNTSSKPIETTKAVSEISSSGNKNLNVIPFEEIKNRCFKNMVVIWVYPPKKELDSIENSLSKDEAETFEQDMGIYNTDAQSFLLDKAEKYMISDSARDYRFIIRNDTSSIHLERFNKKKSLWNIILFDGKKAPKITTPVELEKDYINYFNIK